MSRDRQVGLHKDASHMVGRCVEPVGRWRRCDARGPENRLCRKVPAVDFDTVSRAFGDRPSKCDVHAEVRQGLARISGQAFTKSGKNPGASLDENNARLSRVEIAEIAPQGVSRTLGNRAGELDAGRVTADDDECQELGTFGFICRALGVLESRKNPSPDRGRIVFKPGA